MERRFEDHIRFVANQKNENPYDLRDVFTDDINTCERCHKWTGVGPCPCCSLFDTRSQYTCKHWKRDQKRRRTIFTCKCHYKPTWLDYHIRYSTNEIYFLRIIEIESIQMNGHKQNIKNVLCQLGFESNLCSDCHGWTGHGVCPVCITAGKMDCFSCIHFHKDQNRKSGPVFTCSCSFDRFDRIQ